MCQFSRTHFSFLGTLVHIWEERKSHQSSWRRRRRAVWTIHCQWGRLWRKKMPSMGVRWASGADCGRAGCSVLITEPRFILGPSQPALCPGTLASSWVWPVDNTCGISEGGAERGWTLTHLSWVGSAPVPRGEHRLPCLLVGGNRFPCCYWSTWLTPEPAQTSVMIFSLRVFQANRLPPMWTWLAKPSMRSDCRTLGTGSWGPQVRAITSEILLPKTSSLGHNRRQFLWLCPHITVTEPQSPLLRGGMRSWVRCVALCCDVLASGPGGSLAHLGSGSGAVGRKESWEPASGTEPSRARMRAWGTHGGKEGRNWTLRELRDWSWGY